MTTEPRTLEDLPTPCFIVDLAKVRANCERMIKRCESLGVLLRPHMKTHKTLEAGLLMTKGRRQQIVVSTLAEAEFYTRHAVDNAIIIQILGKHELPPNKKWSILLMVDCGSGRDGVPSDSDRAIELVEQIKLLKNATFAGIYTHSGGSYYCRGADEVVKHCEAAWPKMNALANRIRSKGIECRNVGVGATPTCSSPPEGAFAVGITEFHPGNYVFYDIAQVNIGSCTINDIAGRVLTRVISHYPEQGHMLINCGWLALTLDSLGKLPTGYCVFEGEPNLKLVSMTQELGKVVAVEGNIDFSKYPIGSTLKILPHHACATAAMHPVYYVHEGEKVTEEWKPVRGW